MNIRLLVFTMAIAITVSGCASAQLRTTKPAPLRLDQLTELSTQHLSDDEVIARIEQGGVAFVLSQQDIEKLRTDGVSDGVLRYLQGRASGEQALKARIVSGRYRFPAYAGMLYSDYPYLGYYDGLHYYGSHSFFNTYGFYGGFGYSGDHHHVGISHHGGSHHGGGHHGGHH